MSSLSLTAAVILLLPGASGQPQLHGARLFDASHWAVLSNEVVSISNQVQHNWSSSLQESLNQRQRRIIGGIHAEDEYPWVVHILKNGAKTSVCTGQVFARRWIVTAAHCVLDSSRTHIIPVDITTVTIGCRDLRSANCKFANLKRIVLHPCFTPSQSEAHDDIALLEMDRDLGIGVLVDGLNGTAEVVPRMNATVLGFGTTNNEIIRGSSVLMQTQLRVATREACAGANPRADADSSLDFDNVFCLEGIEGRDTCHGDSGGPALVVPAPHQPWLVGILSVGSELPSGTRDCAVAGRYGVYTLVRRYTAWMHAVIHGCDFAIETCPSARSYVDMSASERDMDCQSGAVRPAEAISTQAWVGCVVSVLAWLLHAP